MSIKSHHIIVISNSNIYNLNVEVIVIDSQVIVLVIVIYNLNVEVIVIDSQVIVLVIVIYNLNVEVTVK